MDRTERTIKAIAEAIARGECPPRTTPREWTHFEKQAKAVFYDLVLTVQLHDDDDDASSAKVGGDEREAFKTWKRTVPPCHAEELVFLRQGFKAGWELGRAALSADGGEESPSLTNPLTPYGMLVRALRITTATTLMDMARYRNVSPSLLSGMEFGRKPVTIDDAIAASKFFSEHGVAGTLGALTVALQAAIAANQSGRGGK